MEAPVSGSIICAGVLLQFGRYDLLIVYALLMKFVLIFLFLPNVVRDLPRKDSYSSTRLQSWYLVL
jgi:hypothetical protein